MISQNLKITPFMNPRMVLIGPLVIMKINTKIFDFCIFDDDNDDLLNTHDPCTMYEIDDNKNNPLNDEEYDHEDDTANSKYYSLINILKQKHVKKMMKNF